MSVTQTDRAPGAAEAGKESKKTTQDVAAGDGKNAIPRAVSITLNYASKESLYMSFMPFLVRGGFFIPTDRVFSHRDTLRLKIVLPGAAEGVQVSGRVVWQTPKNAENGAPQGIGLHLDDLPVSFKLRSQVESLLIGVQTKRMTYTL